MPSSDAKWILTGLSAALPRRSIGAGSCLRGQIESRVSSLQGEMRFGFESIRENTDRMDDRLHTVEIRFAKIDQRLAALERFYAPAAPRGAAGPDDPDVVADEPAETTSEPVNGLTGAGTPVGVGPRLPGAAAAAVHADRTEYPHGPQ